MTSTIRTSHRGTWKERGPVAVYSTACPWYGGWWECLIGLINMSLKKVHSRSRISLPVLQTLIVEVEAILNDRPLTHVSPDLKDAEPLTPANLLHGRWITSLPHEVLEEQDLNDPTYGSITDVVQRAQLQVFLLNQFQAHWKYEYLNSLREHHRTTGSNSQQIKPRDVVLMWNKSPRSTWKLAIVKELMSEGWTGACCLYQDITEEN